MKDVVIDRLRQGNLRDFAAIWAGLGITHYATRNRGIPPETLAENAYQLHEFIHAFGVGPATAWAMVAMIPLTIFTACLLVVTKIAMAVVDELLEEDDD